ncbi:hypothetical protein B4102_3395 [Heyndrickxia sporothermodurans]|uniref:Uncharacterized protein n=1 Tax=Heyndrickxia sporothermodurans TaxID=46224 RepID=A0A150KTM5_9BACI|nr:hypothetical protein B4102_3395 [Heyndrickxia sporothermodurans]
MSKKERLEHLIITLKSKGVKIDWAVRVCGNKTGLSKIRS